MSKKNKKILLVEDDKFIAEIYFHKLSESGFDVKLAEDGELGIELFKEFDPDLVLLDIMLPKKNGWEVLREISALRKNQDGKKVIMLTNLGEKDKVDQAVERGVDGYFVKSSLTPNDLLKITQDALE